jgi:hypothetical protein
MRSTPEEKRAALLDAFIAGRRELCALAGEIPLHVQEQVFLGTWSMLDLFAHLVGWDQANLEAVLAVSAGRLPAFYQRIDRDWQTYNAHLVSKYKRGTLPDLVRAARASQDKLVDRLASLPAKDLYRDFGVRQRGYKVTIARLIEAETRDEKVHLEQARGFVATIRAGQMHPE